jgi:uroporphyrin-III C-methyltransferase
VTVYLVGAGPGDPDLLTRRAARLLGAADVIIADRLIDARLYDEVRPDALIIDVGKHPRDGGASTSQDAINELLIRYGSTGATVVRLKGGDPFLFGRGGEEVAALVEAGIDVEVVPGVTAALGVPALAGVPVTHRGLSAAVTVLSGHDVDAVSWEHYARGGGTLVLMMAVANRVEIARRLVDGGLSASTPVAIIEWGSTPKERRTLGTLNDLSSCDVEAPAVFVVGDVARMMRAE